MTLSARRRPAAVSQSIQPSRSHRAARRLAVRQYPPRSVPIEHHAEVVFVMGDPPRAGAFALCDLVRVTYWTRPRHPAHSRGRHR